MKPNEPIAERAKARINRMNRIADEVTNALEKPVEEKYDVLAVLYGDNNPHMEKDTVEVRQQQSSTQEAARQQSTHKPNEQ